MTRVAERLKLGGLRGTAVPYFVALETGTLVGAAGKPSRATTGKESGE